MAATGKTPILLYGSTTPTNAPAAGNLTNSSDGCEIAINVADKNLFFKDSTNAVNTVPIRQSSGSSDGWLSSANWTTFNSKQAALVSGTNIKTVSGTTLLGSGDLGTIGTAYGGTGLTSFTPGGVVYSTNSSTLSTSANLAFDGTNLYTAGFVATKTNGGGGGLLMTDSGGDFRNTVFLDSSNYVNINNTYTPGVKIYGNYGVQAMQIGAGVSIGNTTDPGAANLSVNGTTYCNTFQNRSSQAVYLNGASSSTDTYSNSVSHVLGNAFTYNQYIQFGGLGGPGLRTDSNYAYCLAPSSTGQWYFVSQTNGVYLNTGATAWASASDLRLKDVTGTYTNALADIAKLEPIKFTWKDDASKKPCVGVSAQSVLPVVPEAVDASVRPDSKDAEAYYSVRYTELIPLLIASIQELQEKLKAAGVAGF